MDHFLLYEMTFLFVLFCEQNSATIVNNFIFRKLIVFLYRSMSKGNIINWDDSEWNMTNFVLIEEPVETICNPYRPGMVFFPHKANFSSSVKLCHQMDSIMAVAKTEEDIKEMYNLYNKTFGTSKSLPFM